MGINHNGTETNLFFPSLKLGAGVTAWAADGIFYWLSDSGGRYSGSEPFNQYNEYTGNGSPTTNQGWVNIGTTTESSFVTAFKTNVFSCYPSALVAPYFNGGWTEGGPGLPVNGSATLGLGVGSWSDVEVKQINNVVTYYIDKTAIFVYTNTTGLFTNGYVMLGYIDPFDGGEEPDTAAYYSNLRVVQLGPPQITTTAYTAANKSFKFNFTSSDGDVTASSFVVQTSTNVINGYAVLTSGATISQLLGNSTPTFQAAVTLTGSTTNIPTHYFRVRQK